MNRRDSVTYVSRFVTIANKLLQGFSPSQIAPKQSSSQFWDEFLSLDVDRQYLIDRLCLLSKDDCVGQLKPSLNALFLACLKHARSDDYADNKKEHAVEILSVMSRALLSKHDLAGWEVMDIFAGGVNESDEWFMDFVTMIEKILGDEAAPALLRHQVLQLAIVFMAGVNQLSPGAYFLRSDLFPSIVSITTCRDTERYTFEAILLLALLANFHKSDAAKLNPYLQRIAETSDVAFVRKISWAANFAASATIRAYQHISDDSPPTMVSSLGSLLTALRPDRALASTPVDPPRELFKNQPIEACVTLLPVFEFVQRNPVFTSLLAEATVDVKPDTSAPPPLPHTLISLSSYLMCHATSSSSPRAIAYANIALNILLAFSEKQDLICTFCEPSKADIRLCRQRLPHLPAFPPSRPPVCSILDCCVLWLRHNLHKRLEVNLYITCIRTCHRVIWHLQSTHTRLEYHWQDFWQSAIGVLDFLSNKLDDLITTGGVEVLLHAILTFLEFALCKADEFLPTPQAIHEFIYELVRSASILRRQPPILQSLALPGVETSLEMHPVTRLLSTAEFYEEKIGAARTAKNAMRVVAKEIEKDGIHASHDSSFEEPPKWSEGVIIFLRHAYTDSLALMP